jgi:hypothetical protein
MAIAFDNAHGDDSATLNGVSYTMGVGSDGALFVLVFTNLSATIVSITYGGVSMTQQGVRTQGSFKEWYFTLLNPPTGTNSFTTSTNGLFSSDYEVISHTGVGSIESATNNSASSGTGLSLAFTTVADGCWSVMGGYATAGGNNSGGSNFTIRSSNFSIFIGDNGPISPAGAVTMSRNSSSSGAWLTAGVVYTPAAAPAAASKLALLGVG